MYGFWWPGPSLLVRMIPAIGRNLARRGHLDHVPAARSGPCGSPTFQRGVQSPDRVGRGSVDISLPRAGHDFRMFQRQDTAESILPISGTSIMPAVKERACTILGEFEQAQTELVGKAGTVESVWLDEVHGLRISIRGHEGKWPVSTIKFA